MRFTSKYVEDVQKLAADYMELEKRRAALGCIPFVSAVHAGWTKCLLCGCGTSCEGMTSDHPDDLCPGAFIRKL